MTLPMTVVSRCRVCGATSQQTRLASTNEFGSPDMDLRPPEMRRSTMWAWLEECPECGYVAADLADPSPVPASFLETEAYKTCDGLCFVSDLAPRFYRAHMLAVRSGDFRHAMHHALETAWLCDDRGDADNARHCRNIAAEYMDNLRLRSPEDETLMVMHLDILRRARRFDDVLAVHSRMNVQHLPDLITALIAFEVEKAKQHDDARYTVAQAAG